MLLKFVILVMFVAAYSVAMLLQIGLAGIGAETMKLTATLVPSTIAGIIVGNIVSTRISELTFRRLLISILAFTTISLFATLG